MAASGSLPSLFGRFTVISGEHEHLTRVMHRLSEVCRELEVNDASSRELRPRPLLAELLAQLGRHFAAEETDGYFGSIARERPALLPPIAELRAEHTSMLEALQGLLAIADDKERQDTLAVPLQMLLGQLRRHEWAESALLQSFFAEED